MTLPHALQSSQVRLASGLRFTVVTDPTDAEDPISASLRAGVFPLPRLLDVLQRSVPPGGRVIDLGAHLGSFTLAAAAAGYEVLCVEASPRNADLIRQSVAANGYANVRVENLAISDHQGSLQFWSRGPYGHVAADGQAGDVTVEATTLDELLARVGWDHADFIKLDIEGSEVAALRGMRRVLEAAHPPILFAESNGHMLDVFGESPRTLKTALIEAGLGVYQVEPEDLIEVSAEAMQPETVVDYLACRHLPAGLQVSPGSHADRLATLARTAASGLAQERLYAARVLHAYSAQLTGRTEAERLRQRLCTDDLEAVRALALKIPPLMPASTARGERKPWWRVF